MFKYSEYVIMMVDIFIVGAKRTPFGTFGGVFRNTSATELQTIATTAALKEAGVAPDQVDSVVVGQVMAVSPTYIYKTHSSRTCSLLALIFNLLTNKF